MAQSEQQALKSLRSLLIGKEEKQLKALEQELEILRNNIEDKESLIAQLNPIIIDLLERKIIDSRDDMAEILAPVMSEAIKNQVAEAKDDVVDALYPIIGKTIRKSVAESMKHLVFSINQKIDQALRRKSISTQIQSKITGVPTGELVLKDAMPFRIEEIFLIHRTSGY